MDGGADVVIGDANRNGALADSREVPFGGMLRPSVATTCLIGLLILYHITAICWFGTHRVDGIRYYLVDDDVMITMQYGRNLARGDGLVYNAGERVEGFTNPLLTFATAALHLLPIDARLIPLLIDILNVALSVFILLALTRFWNGEPNGRVAGLWSGAFYVLLSQHLYYAYAGYEVYIQASMLLFYLARLRSPGRLGACVLGLLPLSHATMVVPWAVLVAALGWQHRKAVRREWMLLLLAVAPFALYECFRIIYYHDVLPNTYWLKVGGGSMRGGLRYVAGWAARSAPIACIALFALRRPRPSPVGMICVLIAASVAEAISLGGDIFPLSRFLFPASVLLAALAGRGAMLICERWRAAGPIRTPLRVAFACLIVAAIAIPVATAKLNAQEFLAVDRWEIMHLVLGKAIQRNTSPGSTVALFGLGYTGYYSDRRVIDMLGKADRHIAHTKPHPGRRLAHNKSDFDYVLAHRPDYIELGLDPAQVSQVNPRPTGVMGYSEELGLHPLFRQQYLPNPVNDLHGTFCHLYARSGTSNKAWILSENFFQD